MYHLHFKSISSTQVYLKDHLENLNSNDSNILISCSEQSDGIGRKGNSWNTYPNSLAFSFTLKPNEIPTLTPIEVGLLIIEFLKIKFNSEILLKWPNDLLTKDGKKCGGIICQYIDSSTVIVGVGVNLGNLDSIENKNEFRHGLSSIDNTLILTSANQEIISKETYSYVLKNRFLNSFALRTQFNKSCYHLNMDVYIFEDGRDFLGTFIGIGEHGEAQLKIDAEVKSFLSSSLTILN